MGSWRGFARSVVVACFIVAGVAIGAECQPSPRLVDTPQVEWNDGVARDVLEAYRAGRRDEAIAVIVRILDAPAPAKGQAPRDRLVEWVHRVEKQQKTAAPRSALEPLLLLCTEALIRTWPQRSLAPQDKNRIWPALDFVHDAVRHANPTSPVLRIWYLIWEAFRQAEIMDRWREWPEYLHEALDAFPRDPQILLAAGSRQELEWWTTTNPRRLLTDLPSSRPADLHDHLTSARNYLRRALEADAGESESRLHLARVLLELDDLDGARDVLGNYQWQPDEPAFEYLARLFEGELAERRGDTAAAVAAYDRAIALVPTPQSAQVAKAHALHVADRRGEALQAATQALGGSERTPDPWWVYSLGQAWRLTYYLNAGRALVAR